VLTGSKLVSAGSTKNRGELRIDIRKLTSLSKCRIRKHAVSTAAKGVDGA